MVGAESLLIDAGNTRLKWATLQAGLRSEQQAESYPAGRRADQAALHIIDQLLSDLAVKRVVLVHVLGDDFSAALQQICQDKACQLTLINSAVSTYGIKLAYPNPAHFGADRLVGLVAARSLAAGRAAIIVDCGTAVTIDGLLADGTHPGGLITPGLGLLSDALIQRTRARHMDSSLFDDPQIFTDNTAAAIGSGCLFSLAAGIEGICQRMQQQMTDKPLKIICGGDAMRIYPLLQDEFVLRPEALMDGLQVIAGCG
ncbi:MAG: type III pantothenate kinase [Thiolinea sp.]